MGWCCVEVWYRHIYKGGVEEGEREDMYSKELSGCKKKHVYYSNKDRAKHIALSIEGKYATYILYMIHILKYYETF